MAAGLLAEAAENASEVLVLPGNMLEMAKRCFDKNHYSYDHGLLGSVQDKQQSKVLPNFR